jgi:diadenosine tetraphosphate (Ap4A) HIT family hydrolase
MPVPGGRIFSTEHWVVEHCVGPLGVGTLVLKPYRHCVAVADLTHAEAAELGDALRQVARCVRELTQADQVYACLWSHAEWKPGHIHFVVQPAWAAQKGSFSHPGPTLQSEMFRAATAADAGAVARFSEEARAWFDRLNDGGSR